ncbi:hypothetical protein GFS31_23250 [Leptolyngbya sp. BL0902]|uniref:hypothetical protein n=1 Tax=Leptolyngbya sp. BL0902 TaxID=1115757 RepID=UPI0018E7DA95|nr:hypothetical protein [Leptolyngbya sp. BL0902]QQE65637.1 hypothetical protein GFS31_23250 [Leptolyngbya sp. BL0902]
MEYWEFLLQQEGDHHWLPLDTAQMEILEGRYRIMAHTSAAHTPVRVQVSQRLLDQDPPKRRHFKRQGQTNADGLMVVIPFTRLQAGTWDIHCSSVLEDAASSATEEAPWAYRVQLQVLPPGGDDDEVWLLPSDEADLASAPVAPVRRAVQPALDLEQAAAALDEAQADLATGDALQGGAHRLHLTQTALLGQEGSEVDLTGHVVGAQAGEPCAALAWVVRLVDPQTATAVALTPFALEAATLPADFHLSLSIPPYLETRLLLGELALVHTPTIAVLALQRFTLTVDLASVFDTIANQAEAETDYILDFAGGGPGQTLTGEAKEETPPSRPLDLPQGPPRSVPVFTLPRDGLSLPPKLYEPSPHEASARRPTLPPFGAQRPNTLSPQPAPAEPDTQPDVLADLSPEAPTSPVDPVLPALSTEPAPSAQTTKEPPAPSSPEPPPSASEGTRSALRLPPLPHPPSPSAPPPTPSVPLLMSHEVAGFRDLNLQERFWSRLNEMAVSIQQEAQDRRPEPDTESPRPTEDAAAIPAPPEPFAGEVVIYEDEDETLGPLTTPAAQVISPVPPTSDEPLAPPQPDLGLPSGDLIAGDPILVTLRVPFHPNRLYLKVWISDPQTRSLVDEPRQVMNLRPNGHNQLEGSLQMTVPLGCLEAEFEAIAVDMMTQQESYKTTVSRAIIPAGLAPPIQDDFDV